jgi:hypothetical protein
MTPFVMLHNALDGITLPDHGGDHTEQFLRVGLVVGKQADDLAVQSDGARGDHRRDGIAFVAGVKGNNGFLAGH